MDLQNTIGESVYKVLFFAIFLGLSMLLVKGLDRIERWLKIGTYKQVGKNFTIVERKGDRIVYKDGNKDERGGTIVEIDDKAQEAHIQPDPIFFKSDGTPCKLDVLRVPLIKLNGISSQDLKENQLT